MSNRSYGILFSEFSGPADFDYSYVIPCLEGIRQKLEAIPLSSSGVFEYDLVCVCSHSDDNCYPEIGVHVASGTLQDSDYEILESIVLEQTSGVSAESLFKLYSSISSPSWAQLKESGSYPSRA